MNVTATLPAQRYHCPCRHLLQVHGGGRHRRYYHLDGSAWRHAVITSACPSFGARCLESAGHKVRLASRHW